MAKERDLTPREQYLANCGRKEQMLRACIKTRKDIIKRYKYGLNNDNTYNDDDRDFALNMIAVAKVKLSAYCREIAKLHRKEKLTEPRIVSLPPNPKGLKNKVVCKKCKTDLLGGEYCSGCGSQILWWRIKPWQRKNQLNK